MGGFGGLACGGPGVLNTSLSGGVMCGAGLCPCWSRRVLGGVGVHNDAVDGIDDDENGDDGGVALILLGVIVWGSGRCGCHFRCGGVRVVGDHFGRGRTTEAVRTIVRVKAL